MYMYIYVYVVGARINSTLISVKYVFESSLSENGTHTCVHIYVHIPYVHTWIIRSHARHTFNSRLCRKTTRTHVYVFTCICRMCTHEQYTNERDICFDNTLTDETYVLNSSLSQNETHTCVRVYVCVCHKCIHIELTSEMYVLQSSLSEVDGRVVRAANPAVARKRHIHISPNNQPSWKRGFDPVYSLLFDWYHEFSTKVLFNSLTIWVIRGLHSIVSRGRVRYPMDSNKTFVRHICSSQIYLCMPYVHTRTHTLIQTQESLNPEP